MLTREQAELVVLSRCRKFLDAAELDSGPGGWNPDLNDPLATALADMGLAAADRARVTDSDLTAAAGRENELLDRAEVRLLETIYQNIDLVDIQLGPRAEKFSQLADRVLRAIERKQTLLQKQYGAGVGTLSVGVARLYDINEKSE